MILVIDFGSQYTQLLARRIREVGEYSQIMPFSEFVDVELEQLEILKSHLFLTGMMTKKIIRSSWDLGLFSSITIKH